MGDHESVSDSSGLFEKVAWQGLYHAYAAAFVEAVAVRTHALEMSLVL